MAEPIARTLRKAAGGTVDRALDRTVNVGKPISVTSLTERTEADVSALVFKNNSK